LIANEQDFQICGFYFSPPPPSITTMTETSASSNNKRKHGAPGAGSANGFKALGLSDEVYRGIVRMGFRVSFLFGALMY
jgi:hypothetical protein